MGLIKTAIVSGVGIYAIKKISDGRKSKQSQQSHPSGPQNGNTYQPQPGYGPSPNEQGHYSYRGLEFNPVESNQAYQAAPVDYSSQYRAQNGVQVVNDPYRPLPPQYLDRQQHMQRNSYGGYQQGYVEEIPSRSSSPEKPRRSSEGGNGDATLLNTLFNQVGGAGNKSGFNGRELIGEFLKPQASKN